MLSQSVFYTLYSVKKCFIDSLSVLFQVAREHREKVVLSTSPNAPEACQIAIDFGEYKVRTGVCRVALERLRGLGA